MSGILLIARREFGAYVNTAWGWVILSLALLLSGLFFNGDAMGKSAKLSADVLERFFYDTGGFVLIMSVLLTMRLFAEERQTGTIVLLESSPLDELQMVAGKYLSAMAVIFFFCVCSLYMPALIFVNGKIGYDQIAVGYLGLLLMGSASVAIGTWASSVSRNQILAAAIAAVVVALFLLSWVVAYVTDPPFKALVSYLAFYQKQFQPFMDGRIDTQSVVYFVSVTFAFLLLATRSLAARRWE
jgi:ABC-2 type transport system permease protein